MKRKEPSTWQRAATEHAVKTAKKDHSRSTATEHAAGSYKHTTKRKEPSTWQRAATEHAMKTAKKVNSRSTATEHAVGSSLPEHGKTKKRHAAATTSGPAAKKSKPEVLVSGLAALATRESDLEGLFQEPCGNTSPLQRSLLQQVNTLGHYPKRHKVPRTKPKLLPTV
jgi:hypothetical protein